MHKSATKCNKTLGKWCKNKHGASKIIDTFETYQLADVFYPPQDVGRAQLVCRVSGGSMGPLIWKFYVSGAAEERRAG
jgi:hypothetical protein